MSEVISAKTFIQGLGFHIVNTYGSSSKAAKAWDISKSYVDKIRLGYRLPTDKILAEMGYELIKPDPKPVKYRKV